MSIAYALSVKLPLRVVFILCGESIPSCAGLWPWFATFILSWANHLASLPRDPSTRLQLMNFAKICLPSTGPQLWLKATKRHCTSLRTWPVRSSIIQALLTGEPQTYPTPYPLVCVRICRAGGGPCHTTLTLAWRTIPVCLTSETRFVWPGGGFFTHGTLNLHSTRWQVIAMDISKSGKSKVPVCYGFYLRNTLFVYYLVRIYLGENYIRLVSFTSHHDQWVGLYWSRLMHKSLVNPIHFMLPTLMNESELIMMIAINKIST